MQSLLFLLFCGLSLLFLLFLWLVVVALVLSVKSVVMSPLLRSFCLVRYCCLGGGPCAFLESGSSAPSLTSVFASLLQQVMPFKLVRSHT